MATELKDRGNGVWTAPGARIIDRSGRKRFAIGDGEFTTAMATGTIVDKTMLIADILDSGYKATLFCRPRRFGKTLNLTMTKAYLESPESGGLTRGEAEKLFCGTELWEADGGSWQAYQGAYPVMHLSLSQAGGDSWAESLEALGAIMQNEFARHAYLVDSPSQLRPDHDLYERIVAGTATDGDIALSLARLCRMLYAYHRKGVVLLIDEYDAPVMAGYTHGYYDEVVSFMRRWLVGAVKEGGAALAFACLTGVQRISKESIFSGLNNLYVSTPLQDDFDERFGFTSDEVRALASYVGHEDRMGEAQRWYDGYRFGSHEVYNPWSVTNYFNKGCTPGAYWGNTSGNSVLGELLATAGAKTLEDVYSLLEPGGTVLEPLDLGVVFPELGVREGALWSMLYLAGYLTTDDVEQPASGWIERELRIPNKEVAELYRAEVIGRFAAQAGGRDRLRVLHDAAVTGNESAFFSGLGRIARDSMSYLDLTSELPCHALLMGLLFGVRGYLDPRSNREAGYGRYDIMLEPDPHAKGRGTNRSRPLVTMEVKYQHDADEAELESLAHKGLEQIDALAYDVDLPACADGRLRWGVAFSGKHVAVACELA